MTNKKITIDKKIISQNSDPYIVAEMSGNHNQSISMALKMVKLAHEAGADAIKIQTYTADSMTLNVNKKEFVIKDKTSPWFGQKLYDLYERASTPRAWYEKIFKYSKKLGITCFASVFDLETVDLLEKLKVPAYKISSFELNHIPLIKKVALTKKPIILSTGMATMQEIQEAVSVIKKNKNDKLILLHCTSEYPTDINNCNLQKILILQDRFKCMVGYSDHTDEVIAPIVAVSKGAVLLEKHFKISEKIKSVDSEFSLGPKNFKKMILECSAAKKSIGTKNLKMSKSEKFNKAFTRSIYVSKNVKINEIISYKNIKIIRSNKGTHPRSFYSILGKKFKKNLKIGDPLHLKDLR
tara:strand:+ start:464 stop:1522 length:1059 start_codon:yes stop_codon:yes gene_type:complete